MPHNIEELQRKMTIGSDPPSDDDNKNEDGVQVGITKTNDDFNPTQAQIQERAKYIKRGHEVGMINDTTQSSVVIRHDGQINVSANRYAQYKLNPSGKVIEEALESVSLSNRRKIQTDDVVLNEHKLNPYLYELTDIKKLATAYNDNMFVGNFCLFGSVLTMSWETHLKRYVLLRRPARMPMFSTVLNMPEINVGLGVTDPLKIDEELLAKSTKGYQVHAVVSDSQSLIGKEGVARFGTNSGNLISFSDSSSGDISGVSTLSPGETNTPIVGTITPSGSLKQWFEKICGGSPDANAYDLVVAAAQKYGLAIERALATCAAESTGRQNVVSPAGALGLMQLMPSTAAGLGVNPNDAAQNVEGGCKMLKQLYDDFKDWKLAHAAYNAGPGAVKQYGGVPPYGETQAYVTKIEGYIAQLPTDARVGDSVISPTRGNANVTDISGMNSPGSGGGLGTDKVNQLIAYGTSAGNARPSNEALEALKMASQVAGIPLDWIMGMWIHETGWSLAGNKAAVEFKNYGNMHGDDTKMKVLKQAGVQCELAHWQADGTNDWVKFPNASEAGKGWAVWIRYKYSNPPAVQQKTAENFYKCLFNNKGAGFESSYAASSSGYVSSCLGVLKSCGGGTVLS